MYSRGQSDNEELNKLMSKYIAVKMNKLVEQKY